jgi:acyl carrier protein
MISFYDNGDDSGLSVSFDAPINFYTQGQLRSIATALLTAVGELADDPTAHVNAARTTSPPRARQASLAAMERPPYRAPRNQQEEQLSRVFADALGVENVGIDDDFFQLGGNSLLAINLIAKLRKELDAEVAIRDLFQAPTIAQLAERGSPAAASARPTLRRMT